MRNVELFSIVSQSIDYPPHRCYNTSVAGACTQALDTSEVHLASDAPGWVAESLRTLRNERSLMVQAK